MVLLRIAAYVSSGRSSTTSIFSRPFLGTFLVVSPCCRLLKYAQLAMLFSGQVLRHTTKVIRGHTTKANRQRVPFEISTIKVIRGLNDEKTDGM